MWEKVLGDVAVFVHRGGRGEAWCLISSCSSLMFLWGSCIPVLIISCFLGVANNCVLYLKEIGNTACLFELACCSLLLSLWCSVCFTGFRGLEISNNDSIVLPEYETTEIRMSIFLLFPSAPEFCNYL